MNNERPTYKWNIEHRFNGPNDKKIQEILRQTKQSISTIVSKWEGRDDYLSDPKVLSIVLNELDKFYEKYGFASSVQQYVLLLTSLNCEDKELKALSNKITEFVTNQYNRMVFFEIRLSKVSKEIQTKFLNSPILSEFKHYLEKLFTSSKYILTEPEEKIMILKNKTSRSNWIGLVDDLLSKYTAKILSEDGKYSYINLEEAISLTQSPSQKVRGSAAKIINRLLQKYIDIAEVEINNILEDKKTNDKIRGYQRPDESRHISDDIDSKIVNSLILAVSDNFDIPQRYYELKSKLSGKRKLKYHERNIPLGKIDKKFSVEDTINIIQKVFGDLDKEFLNIFDDMISGGYIDFFPKKGKTGGAFCSTFGKHLPIYVMLNHTNKHSDVSTLAHEMGHAINYQMVSKHERETNFEIPVCVAEVASTFMEDFVLQEISEGLDDESRLIHLMEKLNSDISSVFRQVACYSFELELHNTFREKGYLSHEKIGEIFRKHMSAYMGGFVEQNPGSQNWWMYWGHIRNFFYVYSYASGVLISKSLQNKYQNDNEFIGKIKIFLSSGGSFSPKEIFQKLGIDITKKSFWDNGLAEIRDNLNLAFDLAKKLGKIK